MEVINRTKPKKDKVSLNSETHPEYNELISKLIKRVNELDTLVTNMTFGDDM